MDITLQITEWFLGILFAAPSLFLFVALWFYAGGEKLPWLTKRQYLLFFGSYLAVVFIASCFGARLGTDIFWRAWAAFFLGFLIKTGYLYLAAVCWFLERKWKKSSDQNQKQD